MHSVSGVPVAQYLRTSTSQQPCSIDVQKAAIQAYAKGLGFVIVRTYIDEGRSGLRLQNRSGLSALLHDITHGNNNYHAVLVYDVSRWGRFQDADESAHYEFLCKRFDVPVHYCAESFGDDHQFPTFILKSLKRAMAGEYSRELSAKSFRGQKHLAQLGFRVGARPGYGLRRTAISSDGLRRRALRAGEYKSVCSDHVVLVPGPADEVRCVREIFAMALRGDMGFNAIAADLNQRGVQYRLGRPWRGFTIQRILTNRKYIGWNVWNRTSKKLGTAERRNPADQWVSVQQAFPAIVDAATFEKVQEMLPTSPRWPIEQIVRGIKQLSCKTRLTEKTIAATAGMPSTKTLRRRLCGLRKIYSLNGLGLGAPADSSLDEGQGLLLRRNNLFAQLEELFPHKITEFHLPGRSRSLLRLANGLIVSVITCARKRRKTGIIRWLLRSNVAERDFLTLVCLDDVMKPRYYLIPRIDKDQKQYVMGSNHPLLRTGLRLSNLTEFYKAASCFERSSRSGIKEPRT